MTQQTNEVSGGPGWWLASDGKWYPPNAGSAQFIQAPAPPPPVYRAVGRTNGFAIASMVLGILWIWWVGSLLALIFGIIALKQIEARGDEGKGMAIAGVVLGAIGASSFTILFLMMLGGSGY